MNVHLAVLVARIRANWQRLRKDENGYSTETVLVTALLVVLALAALAILAAKVTEKANGITM
ncbi:hypothetical protein [Actinokineospora cianjurensis]|uniref:Uncharacterized protein n=1 Tax=Actinokineospora cianjurensis TaxID=585224 RepID=A0A421BC51_9PSEU|nr:hypothetical protein [Actinokineospora cianjurensis]RLK61917.1 hypothetical protein CLV68_2462 [Actinokineospora cianjurensis]